MRQNLGFRTALLGGAFGLLVAAASANAQNLLTNGNLDKCYAQEIVPGFFLPKPRIWVNTGTRAISGPYEDEMSSETFAGTAPTPVTTDGDANFPDGVGIGNDGGVFFKGFSGGGANGPATGHLYQDVAATPGLTYTLKGWAGAEANYLGGAQFAVEFLNSSSTIIGGSSLDLIAAGLFVPNGESFNYKQYTVMATAPAGTVTVRARASMLDAISNPAGGGQAYVVDDFSLVVPEPASIAMMMVGGAALLARRRSR